MYRMNKNIFWKKFGFVDVLFVNLLLKLKITYMNVENSQTNANSTFLNYVVNVLKFDVMSFLKDAHSSALDALKSGTGMPSSDILIHNIAKNTAKSSIAVRDTLALLIILADKNEGKEISVNKTLDNAIKNLYFDIKTGREEVNVSYNPPEKDIFLMCDEIVLQSVIYKLFDFAWEQLSEPRVLFSVTAESGFTTITIKYKGEKHKMMESTSEVNDEDDFATILPEFNNPFSMLKLMEKIGLGVLSFSSKDNFNIINFTLHLPTRESQVPGPGKITSLQQHNWKDKKVLVVDDIEVNFIFLETIFSETGVKTLYATNGKIAVEMCKKHKDIDLVLMDIKMPVMDGYEATKIIKKENPNLPVVIQTAYSFNEEYDKCRELGCSDYITKPLKSENVLSVLAKYLSE